MEIREKIESDFKKALKDKEKVVISTLRMVKSALHNKEIEKKGEKLQDAEVIKVIAKQVQEHQDSIEQFTKGKREDLVEKESRELEILKRYLPKQLSEEEIVNVVKKIIAECDAKNKSDFGKVMKAVMASLRGRADGKAVSQIVSAQLESKDK